MQASVWSFTYESLRDDGTLSEDMDYNTAFTTEFIDKVNTKE
jgi:hypothetical protein